MFGIEIEGCARCGGKFKIIASIEEPAVIARILSHLQRTLPQQYPTELSLGARASMRYPPSRDSMWKCTFRFSAEPKALTCTAAGAAGWFKLCIRDPNDNDQDEIDSAIGDPAIEPCVARGCGQYKGAD